MRRTVPCPNRTNGKAIGNFSWVKCFIKITGTKAKKQPENKANKAVESKIDEILVTNGIIPHDIIPPINIDEKNIISILNHLKSPRKPKLNRPTRSAIEATDTNRAP